MGSDDALAWRLRSARQRAAALLNATIRDCEREGTGTGSWSSDAVAEERALLAAALAALLTPAAPGRHQRSLNHEAGRIAQLHAFDAQLERRQRPQEGAALVMDRTHGER